MAIPRDKLAGEVVSFKTKGVGTVGVDALRNLFVSEGFLESVVPDLPIGTLAKRALREVEDGLLVKQIQADGQTGHPRFQITEEKEDADGELDYTKETVYTLDPAASVLANRADSGKTPRATAQLAITRDLRTRGDVRGIVKKLFEQSADLFCINEENGGSYFVPAEHFDFIDRVDRVLHNLGGEIRRFPVPKDSKEGKRSIQGSMTDWFERLVAELDDAAEKMKESRPSTMKTHVERYNAAKLKLDAAVEYLGGSAVELSAKIEAGKKKMMDTMEAKLAEADDA